MNIEVILTDRANNQVKQSFGDDLKAASKCLLDSWNKGSHRDGEIRKNGEVVMQFGY